MANPSAEDLLECVMHFDELQGAVDDTDQEYQKLQLQMLDLRKETLNLWRALSSNLRLMTHELADSAQRRVLRAFGYRFRVYANNEQGPEVEAPESEGSEAPLESLIEAQSSEEREDKPGTEASPSEEVNAS